MNAKVSNGTTAASTSRLTYTVTEAAKILGIGRGLAYELVRQGTIPSIRLGERRILVPHHGLDALLKGPQKVLASLPPAPLPQRP